MESSQAENQVKYYKLKPNLGTNQCAFTQTQNPQEEPIVCEDKSLNQLDENTGLKFAYCSLPSTYLNDPDIRSYPVFYGSIIYNERTGPCVLFNVYINFTPDEPIELVLADSSDKPGTFSMVIKKTDDTIVKSTGLDVYYGDLYMIKMIKSIINTEEMGSMIELKISERRQTYRNMLDAYNYDSDIPQIRVNISKLAKQYRETGKI